MPQGSIRIQKALANVAVQYKNAEYIAGQVMPEIPVMKDADKYWIYNRDFRLDDTLRADKSYANMVTWAASTATYYVQEHALKDAVSENDRMNSDIPGSLDVDTVEFLTDKLLIRYEYEVAKLLFTTTTFSSTATLTSATSWRYTTITSAPIQNVLSATGAILGASGKMPNTGIIGWAGFEALKENGNIYGRVQYVERALVTSDLLASVFDLDRFVVGKASYDTAAEGATSSLSYIWGSDCLIAYFDGAPGIKKVTAAATFRVREKGVPFRVRRWYDEGIDADYIEVGTKFGVRAIATSCAYLFKSVAL